MIFSALCGIDISTCPKQAPFYYIYIQELYWKHWRLGSSCVVWQKRTTRVAWGQKTASAQVSLAEKWFLQGVSMPRWERNVGSNRTALPEIQGCNFEETTRIDTCKAFPTFKIRDQILRKQQRRQLQGMKKKNPLPISAMRIPFSHTAQFICLLIFSPNCPVLQLHEDTIRNHIRVLPTLTEMADSKFVQSTNSY